MRISERHLANATVLDLAGPMVAGKLEDVIEAAVGRQVHEGRRLVLADLRHVSSIGAAGLGQLVTTYTTMRRRGGMFWLACVPRASPYLLACTVVRSGLATCD